MAWLWVLSLVLVFLAGFATGSTGRWGRAKPPAAPAAVCPCGHGMSFHEGGHGACRQELSRTRYDTVGDRAGVTWVRCACQVYAGPDLVSSVTLQPVVFREVTSEGGDPS